MLKFWKQLILQSFSQLTLLNKCIIAFNKISYQCNKMHRNKLPGTLIFKIFRGNTRYPCAGGGALLQHIIPQDRRCRDEIVLRLLYNFLLLHFFNLKTLQPRDLQKIQTNKHRSKSTSHNSQSMWHFQLSEINFCFLRYPLRLLTTKKQETIK